MKERKFFPVKHNNFRLKIVVMIGIVFAVLLFSFYGLSLAFFMSRTVISGDINFANIDIEILKNNETYSSEIFSEKLENIMPGDEISFADLSVKNTGTKSIYALLRLILTVDAEDADDINYDIWYDLDANVVNTNFTVNTTGATFILPNETKTTTISFSISNEIGEDYAGADIYGSITAYAIQSQLQDANKYENANEYACYLIVKDVVTVTGEPAKKS